MANFEYVLESRTRYQNYPRRQGEPAISITGWEQVFTAGSMAEVDSFAKEYLESLSPDGVVRVDKELGVYSSSEAGVYPQEQCRITIREVAEVAPQLKMAFIY